MIIFHRLATLGAVLAVALATASVHAGTAVSISGNGSYGNAAGSWGWEFETTTDLTVTALGVYDSTGAGLPEDTTVGIWRVSDQTLIGSAVVPTNGTLVDGFRYESVSSFNLSAASAYRIVFWNPNGFDVIGYFGQNVVWAPEIQYQDAGVFNYDSGTFSFPDQVTTNNLPKYFGPNFMYTTTAVPALWPESIARRPPSGYEGMMA